MDTASFYVKLLIAITLCSIGLLTQNMPIFLSCMLISPVLDLLIEISQINVFKNNFSVLLLLSSIFIPAVFGFFIAFFAKITPMIVNIAKGFYHDHKINSNLFLMSFIVAFVCGLILHLVKNDHVIGVAINLATALLPQNFAMGFMLNNILFNKSQINNEDLIICLMITFINIFGLLFGSSIYKNFLKKYFNKN